MTYTLVQPQTHRTPNISIHQISSTQNETPLLMAHSINDDLFLYKQNSTNLFHFLQRFASEPQMSIYHSISNGFLNKNATFLPLNEPEEEEKINDLKYDKIEPIITVDTNNNQLDNISPATIIDELDDDIILNTTSSLDIGCHFCKPKQRSSLTRISSSNDEIESIITDSIEKISNNNNQEEKTQEISENLLPFSTASLSLNENNEKKEDNLVKEEESNDKTTSSNRFRERRSRYHLYCHKSSTSQESTSDNIDQFVVPTKGYISSPSSTSPSSPISLTTNVPSSGTSSNILPGGLKRTDSIRPRKRRVRFADSVGCELAQVQYIQSLTEDDSKEFSFVKNNLYVPKTFNFEHKPWSFDFALTSKQIPDIQTPKRFFCLFCQPNSKHPDIYLHEIWKSHIKLEHVDICLKSSSTSEQYLYGILWVTNDSHRKYVTVKYTFNRWLNTYEYEAQYCYHSNDFRNIDQFEFSIGIPHDIDRIDFVLRYCVNGQEHWDNNEGKNYTLETESTSTPQTTISLPHDFDINEMRFY